MNIDELKAGRELDALIAEKVMGLRSELSLASSQQKYEQIRNKIEHCPIYSTDIAAAWEVVEKMNLLSADFKLVAYDSGYVWVAEFKTTREMPGTIYRETIEHKGEAESSPHAICIAALKAIGGIR